MKKISAIEMTMKLVGGKWKCLILYYLIGSTKRTRDLLNVLEGISQKVLTEQLRQLEAGGLVARKVFPEVPPRVEYRLSSEGETFVPVLRVMCDWGKDYDSRHDGLVMPCSEMKTIKRPV